MYLSPDEIHQNRLDTLHAIEAASRAWIDATGKLSDLILRAGRQMLDDGERHLRQLAQPGTGAPTLPLDRLDAWRSDSADLVRDSFAIIAQAHQTTLQIAREQVGIFDLALKRGMAHAIQHADAETGSAIGHVRNALEQAETCLNELTDSASRSVGAMEAQVRQIAQALANTADEAPPAVPAPRRTRKPRAQ